jgi:probable rRNA maturation factor
MPDGGIPASRGLAGWLAGIAPGRARGDVTVAIISDRRMRVLNRTFRGKDHVTDVLSFPVGSAEPPEMGELPAATSIGDIVIANGVATRQARDHGHGLGTELRILALHGLLHLLGYDHETDGGRMARAEARLRKKAGLPAGLIARASPRRRS